MSVTYPLTFKQPFFTREFYSHAIFIFLFTKKMLPIEHKPNPKIKLLSIKRKGNPMNLS